MLIERIFHTDKMYLALLRFEPVTSQMWAEQSTILLIY